MRECTTRVQPSTSTKRRILKGRDTSVGGSMNMPIDMRTEEMTKSITRNGMKIMNPMVNALCTSESTKEGTTTVIGNVAGLANLSCWSVANISSSALPVCFSIQDLTGTSPALMACAAVTR